MKTIRLAAPAVAILAFAGLLSAAEFHVSVNGRDVNPGTPEAPFRTIQRAADLARPGDVVTVHAGIYRERVNPPRGGESDAKRIVYRAAPGEKAEIRGSEAVTGWTKAGGDVWTVTLPNSFFGSFNPYADLIHGDWFNPLNREHHTGAVYLDGAWLAEAASLDEVMAGPGREPLWFGRVGAKDTTLWAQFPGTDPNARLVEINVRRTVFYPDRPGRNYITVRGFTMTQAATNWAPPTAEQVALIGTHWSRGWVIEDNTISHSVCSGLSLGKHGDAFDNTSADTAEGYVKTIERAHAFAIPWTRETVGGHVVRGNTISHCEQAGIVGSLGCAFSTVEGNTIHDVHVRRLFSGAEMAGIKFHGAIDTVIRGNHVYDTCRGLWLDWMAQNTRVSRNLFHGNASEDLFVEVHHGPFLVDNNLFLSRNALLTVSQGGAYVHNLVTGALNSIKYDARLTPFHPPHSTTVAGLHDNPRGDDRYLNNLFLGDWDETAYDDSALPVRMAGNVFLGRAKPSKHEDRPLVLPDFDAHLVFGGIDAMDWRLEMTLPSLASPAGARALVTTERLGKAAISGAAYENPDGTPLAVDVDFFGKPRDPKNPTPGPFEGVGAGPVSLKVR